MCLRNEATQKMKKSPLIRCSRFEAIDTSDPRAPRRPKGRPSSHHKKLELGRMVDEKFRQLGGYEGKPVLNKTLLSFSKKTSCPRFSRSTARRYWKYYLEHKSKKGGG